MNRRLVFISVYTLLFLGITSCKSEFESIRSSGDTKKITKKAGEYFAEESYLKAQTLYELVLNSVKGTSEAEKIYFNYAQTHFHMGNNILAAYYFKTFSNTFPNSSFREEADFMQAFNYYKLSPSFRLDQSYSEKAIQSFQLFANTYPNSPRLKDCNNYIDELRVKLEEKAFDQAFLYYNLKQYQSATHAFENLLRDFPDSDDVERVRFLMSKASYLLAKNSVYTKQEERYEQSIEYANLFNNKYKTSEYLKEINQIIEDSTIKLKSITK